MRWVLRRVLAGCGVLTALVAGCSSGGQPSDTLPQATAAPSTSATPTLAPLGPPDLPMPAAARTQDAAGVEAFVRYYIALINRTSQVMDAAPLRDFSQGCEDCDRIAANTEREATAGHAYRGGEVTITSVAPATTDGLNGQLAFRADQAQLTVIGNDGRALPGQTDKAVSGLSSGATVHWNAGRQVWIITQLTVG